MSKKKKNKKMKLKAFDRDNVSKVKILMQSAMKVVEKAVNVKIKFGTVKYQENSFRVTVDVMLVSKLDKGMSADELKYAANFKDFAKVEEIYDKIGSKKKQSTGKVWQLVGCSISSRKYPVIARNLETKKLHGWTVASWKGLEKV